MWAAVNFMFFFNSLIYITLASFHSNKYHEHCSSATFFSLGKILTPKNHCDIVIEMRKRTRCNHDTQAFPLSKTPVKAKQHYLL